MKKEQLGRHRPKPSPTLTLDNLHGSGEAAVWGRELAKDLDEYRSGQLPWADVDRGVLVSGPTGTGKTTFAQALARSCKVPIHIHSLARWQAAGHLNDLLKAMRRLRRRHGGCPEHSIHRRNRPVRRSESLEGQNEQYGREVINAFLECLDGVDCREGVVVVGATNLPDKIDKAILRPGRLGKHVKIPLPDFDARIGILRHHLRDDAASADLADIASRLEGASGAVIEQMVRDARRKAAFRTASPDLRGPPARPTGADCAVRGSLPRGLASTKLATQSLAISSAARLVVNCSSVRCFGKLAGRFRRPHIMRQIPGRNLGKAAYVAQIAILLSGIAAEEIVFGDHADGAGGSDDSDLRQATLIAATMEVSLGLGKASFTSPRDNRTTC
ncbi:MAG: AAA family ATPase [Rhodopseudomonas palustris]|nr:AAA family ATPase [Rhodopseudomonas palustris]